MCYSCSENKGADQLRGYRVADLHLCFRICKKPVFSQRGSFDCIFSFALQVLISFADFSLLGNHYANMSMQYTANFNGCKTDIFCMHIIRLIK